MSNPRILQGNALAVMKAKAGVSGTVDIGGVAIFDQFGNVLSSVDKGDGTSALEISPLQGGVIRTNAGGPAPGQANKVYSGTISIATGATVALETVAAGKTFYVTDIYIGANTATQFLVQIQAAAVGVFFAYCKGDTGPVQMPGIETQPTGSAGQAITLVFAAAAATTASWFIAGVEQ